MPTSFTITAAASSVELVDRAGTATFTVTSNLPAPVRAQARVWSAAPGAAGWMTLEGAAARQLAPGATESFQVSFRPGPDVPAGTYDYRLDVVDTDNPDDNGTQGPVGTVTVPAPPAVPVKRFPWWIVAVAAVVLLLAGALGYAFTRDPEPKPVATPSPTPTLTSRPRPTISLFVPPIILLDRIRNQHDGVQLTYGFFGIGSQEYDADSGAVVDGTGDLRWRNNLLHAGAGAAIDPRGAGPFPAGKSACANGFGAVGGGVTPTPGERFCVRTNEGRIAELIVRANDGSTVTFDARTYE